MPTLVESRTAAFAEAIQQYEAIRANPPIVGTVTPSMIATGIARKYACTHVSAGEVERVLSVYLAVRQPYFEVYPSGTVQELQDNWEAIQAAYDEAEFQRCLAGQSMLGLNIRDLIVQVIEA